MERGYSTKENRLSEENDVKPKSTVSIAFLPSNQVVQASHGQTLLEAALAAKIEISHSCGGNGTCGTCRVIVLEGLKEMLPRNEIESEIAGEREFLENERLCCQNFPTPGLVLEIPESSS